MRWDNWILLLAAIVVPLVGLRYRRWIALISLALGAAIFWGAVFAALVGWAFGILGDARLVFAGLPVSTAVAIFAWKRLPHVLEQ